MNRNISSIILAVALAIPFAATLHSQTAAVPKSTLQQLQDMRAKNKATLEKQEALLLKLEELNKEASQIKFLTKRG
jgi:hypothetical protein